MPKRPEILNFPVPPTTLHLTITWREYSDMRKWIDHLEEKLDLAEEEIQTEATHRLEREEHF